MGALRVVSGHEATVFVKPGRHSADRRIREIARALPELVGRKGGRDRWSREEFLAELKWSDAIGLRRSHQFPIGAFVQRNVVTEQRLLMAIGAANRVTFRAWSTVRGKVYPSSDWGPGHG